MLNAGELHVKNLRNIWFVLLTNDEGNKSTYEHGGNGRHGKLNVKPYFAAVNVFGYELSPVELAGTVFSIAGVWLVLKKSIWNFPIGIVSVLLQAVVYFQSRLYSDASLQIVYVILLVYGWFQWNKKDSGKTFHAGKTSDRLWAVLGLTCIVSTVFIGAIFKNYTDASLPYFDSLLTSASLIAQWMIAKKKIENWIVWIVVDALYVGMYIYKGLYLFSALYFVFILLAIAGYREWKKVLVKA
jgi:nicotinamide mononucleotide transporter